MKYIIFENKNKLKMPVIFPDHITHNQVRIEGAEPVSAGYCGFEVDGEVVVSSSPSTSLNLSPKKEDAELLTKAVLSYGTYVFMGLD